MPNIEQAKQKMKEAYAKKVDLFFDQYEEKTSSRTLDINGIESLIGKGIQDAREVLVATSEELIKTEAPAQDAKKKRVPTVKKH
jgi:hypothetical protein